jgi:hypothetical protein
MEEVSDAFLTFEFYGFRGQVFGCVKEGLCKGQGPSFFAHASEGGFDIVTELFREPCEIGVGVR